MDKAKKIVLFTSGKGSNARSVIKFAGESACFEVAVLYATHALKGAMGMAQELGVHTELLERDDLSSGVFIEQLNNEGVSLVVLAGFLHMIPACFLKAFNGKVINIHPSLLPAHGGAGMYGTRVHEAVIAAGDKESGCSIHYVDEDYDTGKLIAQARCPVLKEDDAESLAARVLELEHELLPLTIERLMKNLC